MVVTVVSSNILVQFLLGDWLTWAAFTYPIAFLITDVTNRLLGAHVARRVVLYGFGVGVLCSLIASQLVNADGFPLTTLRIALGSGVAFLVAQLTDVFIFSRIKSIIWWKAPLVSSLVGSALDTVLFFSIAFSTWLFFISSTDDVSWANVPVPLLGAGPEMPLWISLALTDFGVKMSVALTALIPFRLITKSCSDKI